MATYDAGNAEGSPGRHAAGRPGAEDTEAVLAPLLTRFARWSAVRAALQVATFVVVVAAVTAGRASVPSGRVALYPSVSG